MKQVAHVIVLAELNILQFVQAYRLAYWIYHLYNVDKMIFDMFEMFFFKKMFRRL